MKKFFSVFWTISKFILIYFAFQVLAGGILGGILGFYYGATQGPSLDQDLFQASINKYMFLAAALGSIVSLLIYNSMFKNKEKTLWQLCNFKMISLRDSLILVILSIGASLLSISFIIISKDIFKSYETVSKSLGSGVQTISGLLCVVVFIPIFEEILFRGIIFNELRKHLTLMFSVVLQALIFGIVHGNIAQGIYALFLGILASLVYIWSKSILSCILLHISFNLLGTVVLSPVISDSLPHVITYVILGTLISVGSLWFLNRYKAQAEVADYSYEQGI